MRRRRASLVPIAPATAVVIAVGACGAFTAEDQSPPLDGGPPATTDDAAADADGATRISNEASVDGEASLPDANAADASQCTLLFSDAFETGTLSSSWSVSNTQAQNPSVTGGLSVEPMGHSLGAVVKTSSMTGYDSLATWTTTMIHPRMVVTYALYISAWMNFDHIDFGCSLQFDSVGAVSYVDFEAQNAAGYSLLGTSSNAVRSALVGAGIQSGGWYDVVLTTSGFDTSNQANLTTSIVVVDHATKSVVGNASVQMSIAPVTAFTINCGVPGVVPLTADPNEFDVWVDDVVVNGCL
jgi:hypothetical protein